MNQPTTHHRAFRPRQGTSVLSATVVFTLVAVVASYSLPRWLKTRELETACGAIDYLSNIYTAQESYRAEHGCYADDLGKLDLALLPPTYFEVGDLVVRNPSNLGDQGQKKRMNYPAWSISLQRYAVQTVYAPYTITCSSNGFEAIRGESAGPLQGLQPKIGD